MDWVSVVTSANLWAGVGGAHRSHPIDDPNQSFQPTVRTCQATPSQVHWQP